MHTNKGDSWWWRGRNRHVVNTAAVVLMIVGGVLVVRAFAHAFRLGYDGWINEIPFDALPNIRLGVFLVCLPGAVAFTYAILKYRRFSRAADRNVAETTP